MTSITAAPGQTSLSRRGPAVTVLMMTTAILVVGQLYAYIPLLPVISHHLSASAAIVGWTIPAFALAQALGLLIVGRLNQSVSGGRLFAAGMGALAIASVAAALALVAGSGPGFILARVAQGLTAAVFPPLAFASIVENNSARFRPVALGLFSASLLMSAPIGQLIAAAISATWSVPAVFLASAAALAIISTCLWLTQPTTVTTPGNLYRADAIATLFHGRTLGRLYALAAVLLMGIVFYYAAVQAGVSGVNLQRFRLLGAPAVLMTLVAGAILRRWASPTVLALGLGISACGALLSGLSGAGAGLQAGHWLMLGGIAIAVPSGLNFLGGQPEAHRQRSVVFYTFILFAGASLGTPLVRLLGDQSLEIQLGLLAAVYALAACSALSYRWWPSQLSG